MDKGPECTSKALDLWSYVNGVMPDFSRPGTPTDNAHIASFNRLLSKECLNPHCFLRLGDARDKTQQSRPDYNRVRTHASLGNRTPEETAQRWATPTGHEKPDS